MATDKQLAANRANAQKSTGPHTFEGRRRVLAKAILIEGECEEGFLKLCKAHVREYNPQPPNTRS